MKKLTSRDAINILKTAFKEWNEDKAPRLGAALAYYAVFSMAPLLLLGIRAGAAIYGNRASAQAQLVRQLKVVVGSTIADAVNQMLVNAHHTSTGMLATIIGLVVLIAGASGVFSQLQDALNTIFEVAPKPGRGLLATIKDRFASYIMVLGILILLLISLAASTMVAAVGKYAASSVPFPIWVMSAANFIVSFLVVTLLFAMIYKVLPDVKIGWGDVWIGAAITSLLFTVGKLVLGIYMGHSNPGTGYGAAGSLVALLLWIYYAAQILFFGAEITQVYANQYGSRLTPADNAIPLTDAERANQGIPRAAALQSAAHGSSPDGIGKEKIKPAARTGSDGFPPDDDSHDSSNRGRSRRPSIEERDSAVMTNSSRPSGRVMPYDPERRMSAETAPVRTEARNESAANRAPAIVLTLSPVSDRHPTRGDDPADRIRQSRAILAGIIIGVATSLHRMRRF